MDISYPKTGEKLFVSGNYSTMGHIPASINGSTSELLDRYYNGFKTMADVGVKYIEENRVNNQDKDRLIFPIIFNYRHFLELILKKYAIKYIPDLEMDKLGHSLGFYWNKVRPLLKKVYGNQPDFEEVVNATESYILQFQSIDNGSFTFRYPFAKGESLTPFFFEDFRADLVHLKKRMDELYNLLEYLEDSLEKKT